MKVYLEERTMPQYQINFSGLIAFVPHTNKKEVMVLLADGTFRHRDPSNEELFPHFPFILYNLKDLSEESPRRPELTGRGFGLNFLSLEELTIGYQPEEPKLEFRLSDDEAVGLQSVRPVEPSLEAIAASNGRPRFREAEDLRWIMPIDKIGLVEQGGSRDQFRIDKKLLAKEYEVDSKEKNKVAARTRLRSGRLFTRDFQRAGIAGERLNTVCNFLDGEDSDRKPHFSQAISTLVTYEPPDSKEPLKISSRRFAFPGGNGFKNGSFPDLVFRTPKEAGRDIVVNIWNAPMADILDVLGGTDKHKWDRPEENRSFRSFFRLCSTPPKRLPILEKSRAIAAQVQAVAGPTKDVGCPTSQFLPEDFS
jgi:hypothetical protein